MGENITFSNICYVYTKLSTTQQNVTVVLNMTGTQTLTSVQSQDKIQHYWNVELWSIEPHQ